MRAAQDLWNFLVSLTFNIGTRALSNFMPHSSNLLKFKVSSAIKRFVAKLIYDSVQIKKSITSIFSRILHSMNIIELAKSITSEEGKSFPNHRFFYYLARYVIHSFFNRSTYVEYLSYVRKN